MEGWLLATKVALVLFVVARWIETGTESGAAAVLLILGYVCLSALGHIVKGQRWRRSAIAATFVGIGTASALYSPLLLFLFPLAGAELVGELTPDLRFSPLPVLLPLPFLSLTLWSEYLLCAVFSLFVYVLVARSGARLAGLLDDNERLRTANELHRRRTETVAEYEEQLRRLTQLEERNRLAREVHDRVGHAIAGSVVQLEAAQALLSSDTRRAGEMVRRSVEVLREGMDSIRLTLRGMKPEPQELGIQRVRALLNEFSANSSIDVRLTHTGEISLLTPTQWAVILDNTREALTNVAKHSAASNVRLSIEVLARLVKVEIRDDGRGALSIIKGIGIRGIEERTREAGGTMIVDGTQGFSVITLLPRAEALGGD